MAAIDPKFDNPIEEMGPYGVVVKNFTDSLTPADWDSIKQLQQYFTKHTEKETITTLMVDHPTLFSKIDLLQWETDCLTHPWRGNEAHIYLVLDLMDQTPLFIVSPQQERNKILVDFAIMYLDLPDAEKAVINKEFFDFNKLSESVAVQANALADEIVTRARAACPDSPLLDASNAPVDAATDHPIEELGPFGVVLRELLDSLTTEEYATLETLQKRYHTSEEFRKKVEDGSWSFDDYPLIAEKLETFKKATVALKEEFVDAKARNLIDYLISFAPQFAVSDDLGREDTKMFLSILYLELSDDVKASFKEKFFDPTKLHSSLSSQTAHVVEQFAQRARGDCASH